MTYSHMHWQKECMMTGASTLLCCSTMKDFSLQSIWSSMRGDKLVFSSCYIHKSYNHVTLKYSSIYCIVCLVVVALSVTHLQAKNTTNMSGLLLTKVLIWPIETQQYFDQTAVAELPTKL